MICGVLLFQHPLTIKLLGILPTYIKIDADNREAISIVESLNHLLNGESKIIGVGAEAVVTRLSEVLVISVPGFIFLPNLFAFGVVFYCTNINS